MKDTNLFESGLFEGRHPGAIRSILIVDFFLFRDTVFIEDFITSCLTGFM